MDTLARDLGRVFALLIIIPIVIAIVSHFAVDYFNDGDLCPHCGYDFSPAMTDYCGGCGVQTPFFCLECGELVYHEINNGDYVPASDFCSNCGCAVLK